MGNVSLKVLEKSLNFLLKNGYEPCKGTGDVLLSLIMSFDFRIWCER